MKYFYTPSEKSSVKNGPFSLPEMQNQKFSPETLIWREGFETWKKIYEVEELKDYIIIAEIKIIPPKTPQEIKQKEQRNHFLFGLKISIILSLIAFIISLLTPIYFSRLIKGGYEICYSDRSVSELIKTGTFMDIFFYFIGRYLLFFLAALLIGFIFSKESKKEKRLELILSASLTYAGLLFIVFALVRVITNK